MTTGLPFDLVLTSQESDVECLNKDDSCALSENTISYTYVKDITLDLRDSIPINSGIENEVSLPNLGRKFTWN